VPTLLLAIVERGARIVHAEPEIGPAADVALEAAA
jgi:hypothetical protein